MIGFCWRSNILLSGLTLVLLMLSGCGHFLSPQTGQTALDDARIELAVSGVQDGVWSTDDLELVYSLSGSDGSFALSGELAFDRSLTDTFSNFKYFAFKMSFLDEEGRVLKTVDITPLVGFHNRVPEQLPVAASSVRPPGSTYIAFNYYGVFKGENFETGGGDEWDFHYFPYGEM